MIVDPNKPEPRPLLGSVAVTLLLAVTLMVTAERPGGFGADHRFRSAPLAESGVRSWSGLARVVRRLVREGRQVMVAVRDNGQARGWTGPIGAIRVDPSLDRAPPEALGEHLIDLPPPATA